MCESRNVKLHSLLPVNRCYYSYQRGQIIIALLFISSTPSVYVGVEEAFFTERFVGSKNFVSPRVERDNPYFSSYFERKMPVVASTWPLWTFLLRSWVPWNFNDLLKRKELPVLPESSDTWSWWGESNPQPSRYEWDALPLSYISMVDRLGFEPRTVRLWAECTNRCANGPYRPEKLQQSPKYCYRFLWGFGLRALQGVRPLRKFSKCMRCLSTLAVFRWFNLLEWHTGFEPVTTAWKAVVFPLH